MRFHVIGAWLMFSMCSLLPLVRTVAATDAQNRDYAGCRAHGDLEACYDSLRRNPGDPALLIALGDALTREERPADALRAYKRAAALAPSTPGLGSKISATEAKLSAKHTAPRVAAAKRYSNLAPEAQSH
jgi:Flp pilus assembly protein TadD